MGTGIVYRYLEIFIFWGGIETGIGKSLRTGIGKIWYQKKYRYRYPKYLVPEKSIGIVIVQRFGYYHCSITALVQYNLWSYRWPQHILESYRWARINKFSWQKCRNYKFAQQKCHTYTFSRQKMQYLHIFVSKIFGSTNMWQYVWQEHLRTLLCLVLL